MLNPRKTDFDLPDNKKAAPVKESSEGVETYFKLIQSGRRLLSMEKLKYIFVVTVMIAIGILLHAHLVSADCPCLSEVLAVETVMYSVPTEGWDEWLEYQMEKGYELGIISPQLIKEKDSSQALIKDHLISLPAGPISGIHTLQGDITTKTEDGTYYRIQKGARIRYTLPAIELGYRAKLLKNTPVEPVAQNRSESYKLAEKTAAFVKTPYNYLVTIKINSQRVLERIPGANDMGSILSLTRDRAPAGGYIDLNLEKNGAEFSNARFCLCLRKAGGTNPFVPFEDIQIKEVQIGKVKLKAKVPDIGESGVGFSEPVDLLVVSTKPDGELIAEVMTKEFAVSSRALAIICWFLAVTVPWWIAGLRISRGPKQIKDYFNPIRFVAGKYGRASLSLAQILLWTMLVFSASFYVLVVSGKLLDLTQEVLMLLGVVGGSSIIAKIAASSKDKEGRKIIDSVPAAPRWQDLIFSEGKPDLYKFQMALFTALAAIFVIGKIFVTLKFPELPAGLLTLIGLSNGVYLGAKATTQTVFEKLAETYNSLQAAKAELKGLEDQEASADNLQKEAEAGKNDAESGLQSLEGKISSERDSVKLENLKKFLEQKKSLVEEAKRKLEEAKGNTEAVKKSKIAAQDKVKGLETAFNKLKEEAQSQG